MRPAPAARLPRRLALAVLLPALALAGCSRDLALPGVPSGPSLGGFTPSSAYAGQLLRVSGANFEADAAANTVNFSHASARGERFEGALLVVRVPADAGDGPITVSSREGTSEASPDAFDYLGLGELRRGQIIGSDPILHHPLRVHPFAGELLIESGLLRLEGSQDRGLVKYGAANEFPDFVSASAAAPWRNELYWTVDDATGTTLTVVRSDGASPPSYVASTRRLEGIRPWRILPVRPDPLDGTKDLLAAFDLGPGGAERISTYSLGDLSTLLTPTALIYPGDDPVAPGAPVTQVLAPADVGDGRLIALARDPNGMGNNLVAVISTTDGTVPNHFHPPGSRVIVTNAGDRYAEGLAAVAHSAGSHTAVAALDQGWVALVDLDALPTPDAHHDAAHDWTGYADLVSTYSTSRIAGLCGVITQTFDSRPMAIVTKPDDDLVLGIEIRTASVSWGLATRGAARAAADRGTVWVANDEDNEVQVVNPDLGRQVGRLAFDVAPGTFGMDGYPDPAGGLAYAPADPADPWSTDALYLMALSPTAILKRPLDASEPADALARGEVLTQVAWDAANRAPWGAARAIYADPLQALAFTDSFTGSSPAAIPVPGATWAHRIVFPGADAVVAHDAGLSALASGALAGSVDVPSPTWGPVGTTPDGLVWLTGTWGGADHAALWSASEIAAGGAPLAEWTTSATDPWILWGVWLEDGLWVDTWDGLSPPAMVRLDRDGAALAPAVSVTPAATASFLAFPPAAISPNGRKLVMWEYRGLDTALRIFSADPATGFAEQGYVPLEGTITGAAFDATGERLYVLTQGPDRILTLD